MKKSSFVAMILGTIGGILFALGMCMALIPEWNAFRPGVIMGVVGAVVLLIMVLVWRKMENKEPIHVSGKTIGTVLLGIAGALLLGVGMCLTMVWSNMILGIVIGIAGIVVLLCLIPLTKGLQ
ncbi:MAG TPA: hypothetical protein IAD39_02485 [Candidatus Merdisoma faecalis]|nr:hypothetical protein [Candidatus Merdisoma faecalis]